MLVSGSISNWHQHVCLTYNIDGLLSADTVLLLAECTTASCLKLSEEHTFLLLVIVGFIHELSFIPKQ